MHVCVIAWVSLKSRPSELAPSHLRNTLACENMFESALSHCWDAICSKTNKAPGQGMLCVLCLPTAMSILMSVSSGSSSSRLLHCGFELQFRKWGFFMRPPAMTRAPLVRETSQSVRTLVILSQLRLLKALTDLVQ